jgi:glutamate synthase domain-containing protein 1
MKTHDELKQQNEEYIKNLLNKVNTCPISLGEEEIEKVIHNIFVFYEKKATWQQTLSRLEKLQKQKELQEYTKLGKEYGTNKDREVKAKLSKEVIDLDVEINHASYMVEVFKGLITQTEIACQMYRTHQASNRSQLTTYSSLG